MGLPIFVNRVRVGKGRDVILISAESPSGNATKGEVESVETIRFAVSLSTFAEMTELFIRTLKTIDPVLLRASTRSGVSSQEIAPTGLKGDTFTSTGMSARKH